MHSVKTAFFIAYKSIVRGRKGTFALMMLILTLSYFNMLFVPGVFSGLLNTILAAEINTSTAHIIVGPQQNPVPRQFITDQGQLRAQIATIPGVVGTVRTYLTAGAISFDPDKNGVYKRVSAQVIGIDPTDTEKVFTLRKYIVAGQFLADSDTDQIILPAALAGGYNLPEPNDLGGAKVGDKVQVVYGNGVSRTYTVKGISNIVFGPALVNAYVTAKEADSVLSTSDEASQILVKVDDPTRLSYFVSRVQSLAPNLHVESYTDLLTSIQSVLNAFTLIAIVVSVISILVAAVTIFVMIYVNAVNKRRQIGILKAIGITETVIIFSYVLQSLFYVVCGVACGSVIVFGILQPIVAAHPIPLPFGGLTFSFGWMLITETIVGFLIAGFFSGLIPSRIVVREEILKAIWG